MSVHVKYFSVCFKAFDVMQCSDKSCKIWKPSKKFFDKCLAKVGRIFCVICNNAFFTLSLSLLCHWKWESRAKSIIMLDLHSQKSGLPLGLENLANPCIWKGRLENLEKPWICRFASWVINSAKLWMLTSNGDMFYTSSFRYYLWSQIICIKCFLVNSLNSSLTLWFLCMNFCFSFRL